MPRPKKDNIDFLQFEKLCAFHCTEAEICHFFDLTTKTLNRMLKTRYGQGFSQVHRKYVSFGNISIRRTQFRHAERHPGMAMFLGKVYLGQREQDKADININNTVNNNDITITRETEEERNRMREHLREYIQ